MKLVKAITGKGQTLLATLQFCTDFIATGCEFKRKFLIHSMLDIHDLFLLSHYPYKSYCNYGNLRENYYSNSFLKY